ncbi:hypothetical protein E2562_004761 [Oryza meyeriana var. granulata]|uniref:KIB1-4 beta-propeller domain-containing protein n=1 Tax=Oryza meyeriana var. granulata TaxID=110450 RepID=A0A6G1DDU6_9ORYZ|nr:hypothetical protein E2562_004761 [Oryza meyeriana var. granulata]
MDTFMGHALFVGKGCSKSLTAGAGEEDRIYFMHDDIKYGMPKDAFLDWRVQHERWDGGAIVARDCGGGASCSTRRSMACEMATAQPSSWSDLRPELLDLVIHRLHSLADRIRFRAVCRSWRHIALAQPLPPPMPWLALGNGAFLTIPNGEIHRMDVTENSCCHGSCDNWLFVVHDNGGCSLMNPFTKASVQLCSLRTFAPHKELFSDARFHMAVVPPASINSTPDLLAALIREECEEVKEDSIYFICDYVKSDPSVDPLRDSGVFNMKNGVITPLLSRTNAALPRHAGRCMIAHYQTGKPFLVG